MIKRIIFLPNDDIPIFFDFESRFHESHFPKPHNGIPEFLWFDLIPSPAKHNITQKYLILKSGPETALRALFHRFFNWPPDPWNRFQNRVFEFRHFQRGVEHIADKCCVFEDFKRLTHEFQFFHYLERVVFFQDYPSGC